jgi:hypothetical protein
MSSTFSNLKFELIGNGEQSGTWGTTTNSNIGTAIEQAIVGMATLEAADFSTNVATLTLTNTTAAQDARALCLNIAAGAVSAAGTINVPAIEKPYIVINGSSFTVTVKVSGQTGVAVPAGTRTVVYNNGTDVGTQLNWLNSLTLGTALGVASGGTGAATLTANNVLLGNGTSAVQVVAPGTAGNVLTSNGTTWASTTPATPPTQVYPGAGMAVSTGSAWGTSKTTPSGDVVGTSDTQTLTSKTLTTPIVTQNVQVIGTNTAAVASRIYVLTASLTLTLPSSPVAGNWVAVQNSSGTATAVIDRNSSNIMSLAENMTIDNTTASLTLVYADATRGWVISL